MFFSAAAEKAWLEREKVAQEKFDKKRAEEEQRLKDKEELKVFAIFIVRLYWRF